MEVQEPEETKSVRGALRLMGATMFIVALGFGIVIPMLPLYARDLGATPFQIGYLTTAYAAAQFLAAPFWGHASDRYGRKPVLLLGLLGLSLSFWLMAAARNFSWLLFARIVGGGMVVAAIPTLHAYAADMSAPRDRARVMGMIGAARGLGFVMGPAIGSALLLFGFTAPLIAGGTVALINMLSVYLGLKEPGRASQGSGEGRGAVADVLNPARLWAAITGKDGVFFALTCILMFGQATIMTLLPLFLADRYGASPLHGGLAFALHGGLAVLMQSLVVGPLAARIGEVRMILMGLGLGVSGFLLLAAAPSLWIAIVASTVASAALNLGRPGLLSLLSQSSVLQRGMSMGLMASFDNIGRAVGPLWAGLVYGWHVAAPYATNSVLLFLAGVLAYRALLAGKREPAVSA